MPGSQDELERLKRLRDRQLADRDPTTRDRAFYGRVAHKSCQERKFSLRGVWNEIQARWTWMLGGGLAGIIVAVVFVYLIRESWAEIIGYVMVFAGIVVGRTLGAVVDSQSDGWQK